MSKPSCFNTVIAVVLSTMMALEPVAWAGPRVGGQSNQAANDATDGVRAFTQDIPIDGIERAKLLVAEVDDADIPTVVQAAVSARPENVLIQVPEDAPEGGRDLVFDSAVWTGRAQEAHVFRVPTNGQYPFLKFNDVDNGLKEKILGRIKNFSRDAWGKRKMLVWGLLYAGIQGTFVGMASGNIDSGVAVATAVATLNTFVAVRPKYWNRYLRFSGRMGMKVAKMVAGWTGSEVTRAQWRSAQVVGKFAGSLAITGAQALMVNSLAGTLVPVDAPWSQAFWNDGWSTFVNYATNAATLTWLATINNYNVLDAWAVKKLSEKWYDRYLIGQWVIGGALEVGAAMNYGATPFALFTLTALGTTYMLLSPRVREDMHRSAKRASVSVRYGVMTMSDESGATNQARTPRTVKSVATACARAVLGPPATTRGWWSKAWGKGYSLLWSGK